MGLADSDNVLDDIFLRSSTKTEQNVGKFAPKPGSKLKKPLGNKTKLYDAPSSIEENLGQDANFAKSDAVAVSTKINPVKKASKLVGGKEVLSGVIPKPVAVKQSEKFQPKSALGSKGSKNKSVSFSLPDETEKSPSHEQGLEALDLNTMLEPDGEYLFNMEDSSVEVANEHAEFLENEKEFAPIDDIMDIDSWDEPSIPTKLEIDGVGKSKTLGLIERNSTRTFENDNHMNDDSGDIGDLNKSNNDDNDDEGVNCAPNDMIDTKKTAKMKRKSFEESDSRKALEPKKRIPHGTRRKRRQVDKTLLNKSEHEIDLTQLPIGELILLAEAKERILSKEAAISLSNSNKDSNVDHDNPLDEGFDPDSEEAHRHWLKHAKKVNYHTHMNMSRSRIWSKEETMLFYEAIRDFKTNFGMMAWLFAGRTPRQLKAKFKAEERKHPQELHDALDFRSKDHTLFDKVIRAMKEHKKAEDAAANIGTEEEIGQSEMESAATESNYKADNPENDPWNDGDFDFNESADLELDVNVSLTQNKEEKDDTEKEKAGNYFGDEVNSEKKDLGDDDFELLDEVLESETGAISSQFDEK